MPVQLLYLEMPFPPLSLNVICIMEELTQLNSPCKF